MIWILQFFFHTSNFKSISNRARHFKPGLIKYFMLLKSFLYVFCLNNLSIPQTYVSTILSRDSFHVSLRDRIAHCRSFITDFCQYLLTYLLISNVIFECFELLIVKCFSFKILFVSISLRLDFISQNAENLLYKYLKCNV